MPRYFFHIRKGDVFDKDSGGREIAATEALSDETIEAARDVLADGDVQGLDRREWVFEVADESGGIVLTLPFVDAIEPDVPDPDN
jgi:hypothetical protein